MPNDLTIRPIAPPAPEPDSGAAVSRAQAAPELLVSADTLPNPTLRLDPTLGLVVIEFHNSAGGLTQSIPGQRQLDAYRTALQLNTEAAPGLPVHPSETRTV